MASCAWTTELRLLVAVALLLLGGCARLTVVRREPVVSKATAALPEVPPRALQTGSLWRDEVSANFLYSDVRARFPGDLLTVVVVEDSAGAKEAESANSTDTDIELGIEQFFGLPQALQENNPDIDPRQLVKATSKSAWTGDGSTKRKGQLKARMTAQVTAVAPNGNLWVEGQKMVSVNHEDQFLVVAGWVRPEDINTQNEVLSTRLADGRVEYYGVGVVGIKQRPGWGSVLFDLVWPF